MMKHFAIPKISTNLLNDIDLEWLIETGNTFKPPKGWDVAPRLITPRDEYRIKPIVDILPIKPAYTALIIVLPNLICDNHIDSIGERRTAINVPLQVDKSSLFRYTVSLEDNSPIEEIELPHTHCFNVKVPHCVDNRFSDTRRIVLSFSFSQTVEDLHAAFAAADLL
jgi:hypothetical protein